MYETLPLETLVPNRKNPNVLSKPLRKKLRRNIESLCRYETVTVRPHPKLADRFEILNGHERILALESLDIQTARCDIWDVDDQDANLFLAVLNRLRGNDVPELRMDLLLQLLSTFPAGELAERIPESKSRLDLLENTETAIETREGRKDQVKPKQVVLVFHLEPEEKVMVDQALFFIREKFSLKNDVQALVTLGSVDKSIRFSWTR